jgi:hypothetical protein
MEQQRLPLIGRHLLQRAPHFVLLDQRAQVVARHVVRSRLGRERVLEAQPPAGAAALHQIDMPCDGEDPRRHRPPRLVGAARAVHLHEGVLEQVVGKGGVPALRQQVAPDPSRQRGMQAVERLDAPLEIPLHEGAQVAFGRVHLLLCFRGHPGYFRRASPSFATG